MEELLQIIKNFAINNKDNVYIVGGYIRDRFVGEKPLDIDIVYDGCIDELIRYLKNQGYKIIFIKQGLPMYKVFLDNTAVDIVKLKGDNIIYDLADRDYTINAVALNIIDNSIVDPFDGRRHMKARLLKQVNQDSLSNDRIRILRGIRFILKYKMHFSLDTEESIKREVKYIKNSTKERFLNEFMNIIECDNDGNAFEVMDNYNLLSEILPYINELKTIGKCKYHKVNAYTHMNTTYKVYKQVVDSKIKLRGIENIDFYKKIGNNYLKDYIAVAVFTHDIGKYLCYKKIENKISFKGHDEVGSDIMDRWCNYWRFPKYATKLIVNIVRGHMQPFKFLNNQIKKSKKNFYKFFNEYEEFTPYILLTHFCDMYATNIYLDNIKSEVYKEITEKMLSEYHKYKIIKENKIINGTDIINITGITGRGIKEILDKLDEKRYTGEINNRKQCEEFIKKFII